MYEIYSHDHWHQIIPKKVYLQLKLNMKWHKQNCINDPLRTTARILWNVIKEGANAITWHYYVFHMSTDNQLFTKGSVPITRNLSINKQFHIQNKYPILGPRRRCTHYFVWTLKWFPVFRICHRRPLDSISVAKSSWSLTLRIVISGRLRSQIKFIALEFAS